MENKVPREPLKGSIYTLEMSPKSWSLHFYIAAFGKWQWLSPGVLQGRCPPCGSSVAQRMLLTSSAGSETSRTGVGNCANCSGSGQTEKDQYFFKGSLFEKEPLKMCFLKQLCLNSQFLLFLHRTSHPKGSKHRDSARQSGREISVKISESAGHWTYVLSLWYPVFSVRWT